MNKSERTLFLIDGSAIIYRAFFAFIRNPLINSKGENTSATYGFVNSILKILREESPDYLAVVFDTKEPTFRHHRYAEYKSTRAKMPDELVAQLPRIKETVAKLNIAQYEMPGWEADDIIGTLAHRGEKEGLAVWCVTGDKDYFQLVTDKVRIYYPKGASEPAERLGREEVKAKFGVYPELIRDKLALMGDSSDNVPGVAGIGPKTADTLLEQFGTLEQVLTRSAEISAKGTREKIQAHINDARLSHELVTIAIDVPIEVNLDDLKRRPFEYDKVRSHFLDLEFTNLLKQITPESGPIELALDAPKSKLQQNYNCITTLGDLETVVRSLMSCREIAIDTETTSVDPLQCDLVGISLCGIAGEAWYIPLGHSMLGSVNVPSKEAAAILRPLFESPKVQKFGQNIKFDAHVLERNGMPVFPISFDTMIASYVLNPSGRQHSLDELALRHLDYRMQPITDLIGSGKSQRTFDTVAVDTATYYSAEDADMTFRLRGILAPLIDEMNLNNLYYNIELPLVSVLASMEREGIRVDANFLHKLSHQMDGQLTAITAEIYKIAGGEFNINSTQQLGHVLFEKLNLPTKGKTAKKTGFSTDVSVLEELSKLHPLPQMILEYRQLAKLKSTYVDALPKMIHPKTGRVHTSFQQTIAATGRLASSDPNLQNIPIRTEEGRNIRRAFIARDSDHQLVVADYSQIELRILAHYTEDAGLLKAFRDGEDIHQRTAAEVYGVPLEEVTPDMRRAAKTANFSVIYGVTAYGLSQQSEMNVEMAKDFIDTYFARYPGIKGYIERTKQFARDKGYVTTLFNRRRYVPEINDKNFSIRQFAERIAINTPIQGTAADMIKLAMIQIHERIKSMRSRLILQVHDELVFEAHQDELDGLKRIVREGMENAVKLAVPIVVDMGHGPNWLDAK
jgi:DNA polymerase I